MQGVCKFGFYELFKNVYSGLIGEENTFLYRTSLYLAASASAEFFADIALSPMESAKVRISIRTICKIVRRIKNTSILAATRYTIVIFVHVMVFANYIYR